MIGPAALLGLLTAATTTTKKSSSPAFLIILVVVVGALYFLFLRPQQQKARKARQQGAAYEVGDEVVTVGGVVGTVISMEDDRVTLVTGDNEVPGVLSDDPATRIVFLRQAISRKLEPPVADDEDDEATGLHYGLPEDDEHEDDEHEEHDAEGHDDGDVTDEHEAEVDDGDAKGGKTT
jgi:preprotein translocase subunit YajC